MMAHRKAGVWLARKSARAGTQRAALIGLNLCLSACLTACSSIQSLNESLPWYAGNDVKTIGLQVGFDAQLQHALSVDVVFVYDEALIALLGAATAAQWFQEKGGYLASYGHQMDIIHREIVPGYSELVRTLPDAHKDAKAVFAFADYPSNPNTKASIGALKTPWLLFDSQNMAILTAAPTASTAATGRSR